MTNLIKKKCPECENSAADIHCAVIVTTDEGEQISFNKYTCIKCKFGFVIRRKGDTSEQELTEEFIKSEFIILKK